MKRIFALMMMMMMVSACGGVDPLSEEQKQDFAKTMHHATRPVKASSSKDLNRNQVFGSFTPDESVVSPDATLEMNEVIFDECEVTDNLEQLENINISGGGVNAVLGVGGANCPLSLAMKIGIEGSQKSATLNLDMNYKVQGEEFRKMNDVTELDLQTKVEGGATEKSVKADVSGSGYFVSQSKGKVTFQPSGSFSGNEKSASGEFKLTFDLPDYTAELKMKAKMSETENTESYFINDEEVTAEEFAYYLGSIVGADQVSSQGLGGSQGLGRGLSQEQRSLGFFKKALSMMSFSAP